MKAPVKLAQIGVAADVAPFIRVSRDLFFDRTIGLPSPLTPESAGSKHFAEGSTYGPQPEIPLLQNRALILGTFRSYSPVLTASRRAIYTEISVEVSKVWEEPSGTAAIGKPITIIVPGGTIQIESGAVLSFLTDPREYFLQPAHSYLLAMSYVNEGNFYLIGKSWDLTSGVAQPNFKAKANSKIDGLTLSQLINYLNTSTGRK